MRASDDFPVIRVSSDSAEKLRAAEEFVREQIKPDGVFPGQKKTYRLKDYFESIQVVDTDSTKTGSFQIIFHPREDADRFWKDLVVMIAKSVRDSVGVAVTPGKAASFRPGVRSAEPEDSTPSV